MNWLLGILKWLAGLWIGKSDPAADAAREAGRTKAELEGQEKANAQAQDAARARRDSDVDRILRDARAGQVHADPADPINQDPDLHLRD